MTTVSYSVYRVLHKSSVKLHSQHAKVCCSRMISCCGGVNAKKNTKSNGSSNNTKNNPYSHTVNLPQTAFPLTQKHAYEREKTLQATEGFSGLYSWQRQQMDRPLFVLHDGPPYANGSAHVGHAVNKVLKDITNRYKLLTGHRIHYRPGWDCHGLPIEHKVLSSHNIDKEAISPIDIRQKARDYAREAIKRQSESFQRWGVMGDWNSPYLTMDKQYEGRQLEIFAEMYLKGLVYRDYMPVYWSPSSRTALAEAELEYNDQHVSRAVYVRFPLTTISFPIPGDLIGQPKTVYALIWTTTPWTLPANKAICYSPNIQYALSQCDDDVYITSLPFTEKLGKKIDTLAIIAGSDLAGCHYSNKLTYGDSLPLVEGHHVTQDKGTGLVHTAPAHGHDDFKVALANGIAVECNVTEAGCYRSDMDSPVAGANVLGDANQIVINELGSDILHTHEYTHSYPYDWRTKQPVIIRASQQWFIDTHKLLVHAQESLADVKVYPCNVDWGRILYDQLASRPYWCISRQRAWGVPIPVFYDSQTDSPIINRTTLNHVISLVKEHGSDCWWNLSNQQLLPAHSSQYDASKVRKGTDILDIWFDSGVSWASVLPEECPRADMYLEGVDQLGAWFQTSLLTSVAINNHAPYKNIVIHGFAVDEDGKKMSKSAGNVVDPASITDGSQKQAAYGADTLRWWVAVSGLDSNIYIGASILERCNDTIYALRKSLRFLLGNLSDFDEASHSVVYGDLLPQDQFMLHLLHDFMVEMGDNYENIHYSWAALTIEKFVNSHLSNFYCHIIKDRCYCELIDSLERRSCRTVLAQTLDSLTPILAPLLPHLAEEVYSYSSHKSSRHDMLFHGAWPTPDPSWHNPPLNELFTTIIDIRDSINRELVSTPSNLYRATIECHGDLYTKFKTLQEEETDSQSAINEVLQTAYTTITQSKPNIPNTDGIIVDVQDITGCDAITLHRCHTSMCPRCRKHTARTHGILCDRCDIVMDQLSISQKL